MGVSSGSGVSLDELTADAVDFDNTRNNLVSTDVQAAIEEAFAQAQAAIYPLTIIHNSTVSNGTFFSYSNLTPNTPIVVPINSDFLGFTFSNSNSADFTLDFRNNSDVSTPFETVTKTSTSFFVDMLSIPELFVAGDFISVKYTDGGTNAGDVAIALFFMANTS